MCEPRAVLNLILRRGHMQRCEARAVLERDAGRPQLLLEAHGRRTGRALAPSLRRSPNGAASATTKKCYEAKQAGTQTQS